MRWDGKQRRMWLVGVAMSAALLGSTRRGRPSGFMPRWTMAPADLQALVDYLRTL